VAAVSSSAAARWLRGIGETLAGIWAGGENGGGTDLRGTGGINREAFGDA